MQIYYFFGKLRANDYLWQSKPLLPMRRIILILAACLLTISAPGQEKKVHFGVDASADFFLPNSKPSAGLGVRVRVGNPDQWINFVGGLRYIYGARLSGPQIPLMLNANLLKFDCGSAYLGAGYEFDFIGTYWGCMKYQLGFAAGHLDFRVFYKPYQGDLGVGFTYYF